MTVATAKRAGLLLATILAAASGSTAATASGPEDGFVNGHWAFEGRWGAVGTNCADNWDNPPVEITGDAIVFYESSCDITVDQVHGGAPATGWTVIGDCGGEGETWTTTIRLDLDTADRLTMTFPGEGGTSIRERCPR